MTNKIHDIQLAQAETPADPGFKVPSPASGPAATGDNAAIEVAPLDGAPATDTSARELAIGGGVFLVLLVIFFFARNAYTNHLVRRRVAPSSAESAGWLLFVGLAFLSVAAVLALVNASKYLNLAVTGTLVVASLVTLIAALLVGRR